MDVSIKDITEVEKEISIQASADELKPHFDEAIKRMLPKIEIHGFRKGKAPLNLVKRIHGETIEYDSLDTIATDVYRKVIEERDIHPIGDPVLTDINYKRGEALTFKIKYEIKPQVDLREYKGFAIERLVHPVTEKELEEEIVRIRKANSTLEESAEITDDEHIATVDLQQLDETGSPLIGKKTSDAHLYLADETLLPDLRDALRGTRKEAVKRVTVTREREGNSSTDHLEITVRKVEKVVLPAFDDEFVKKITKGKTTTTADFRKQLREDLERYWRDRSDRRLENAIIGEVVRRHDLPVPESLVKGVLDSLTDELKNRSPGRKLPADFNEESFREQNRAYAVFQAKWYLIRERIIEQEHLSVADAEIEQLAETEASKVGIEKERLLKYYQTSSSARDRLLSDKLMSFLKANQKITDRITDQPFE